MLDRITPIILTLNEAPNIGATLDRLRWAPDVVVVDSRSTDETAEIVARYPNARLVQRKFDTLASQWAFGLAETGIRTEWAMRLDADFRVSQALVDEMAALDPPDDVAAYSTDFRYCILGRPLRGSLYPRSIRLFRCKRARFYQDGHTEEMAIDGRILPLAGHIDHDDRKPLERFFLSQIRYMRDEQRKIAAADPAALDLPDRLRRLRYLGPFLVLPYCLFVKGLILDGRAGFYYSLQRTIAELVLSLYLIDHDLRKSAE
jgi:glycosyltransferase involved in cell wall biosynthesis